MTDAGIRVLPKQGLAIDMQVFEEVRLNSGDGNVWNDKDNRDNILFDKNSELGQFFARFVDKKDGYAFFELKRDGREFASKSEPIDPTKGIPQDLKVKLEQAYIAFHDRLSDPQATDEAKEFIKSLRMTDPKLNPDMYRLYKDGSGERLLVIWGCNRKGSQPLLPLDAIQRLPTYRRTGRLLKIMGLLLALTSLLAVAMAAMYLMGWAPDWSTVTAQSSKNDDTGKTNQPPVPPSEESERSNQIPRTNVTEPPFLFVAPTAVVSGNQVEIVPRTVGMLSMFGYRGERYLHRKASGVDDAEALRFFLSGVRIMAFQPEDTRFPEERISFVVFDKPEVRQKWVRITLPPGLSPQGCQLDWGDGTIEALVENETQYKHAYEQFGRQTIRVIPPETISWAAVEFIVEIVEPK